MEAVTVERSKTILSVNDVRKAYGKFIALQNMSLELGHGEHLLVLGPNGAGKSTLIKCIMDLISFSGKITVGGISVKNEPARAKSLIGYVPQNYSYYETITVTEHAKLTARLKHADNAQIEEKLRKVNLWHVKDKKVKALSDGMKQRLGIGLALIGDPPLLLLDEPTSNVDLRGQVEFQSMVQDILKQGKTLLTTTHLTGLGELATQVMVLDKGRVIARGSPQELLGKLNVNDMLYIRVKEGEASAVTEQMARLGASEFSSQGAWMTASVPKNVKLDVVKRLLESNGQVEDLFIERSRIESEYLKLLSSSETK